MKTRYKIMTVVVWLLASLLAFFGDGIVLDELTTIPRIGASMFFGVLVGGMVLFCLTIMPGNDI